MHRAFVGNLQQALALSIGQLDGLLKKHDSHISKVIEIEVGTLELIRRLDELNPADASAVKVYGTESVVEVYRRLLGILGAVGYLREGSPGAETCGKKAT